MVPMRFQRLDVECTPDAHGHLMPRSFIFRGRRLDVSEILDRWYEGGTPGRPPVSYFKVKTIDDGEFVISYTAIFNAWAILDSPGALP